MKKKLGVIEPLEAAVAGQALETDTKALVEEVYARLDVYLQGCKEMHGRSKDARQIILLQDPYQDTAAVNDATGLAVSDEMPETTLQLQTLKSTYNNCVADQLDNMPEAVMMPERNGLEQQAQDMTDIVRFILSQNDYEAVHRKRVEDFLCTGTAVTQIAWDKDMDFGKGGVAVIRWPVEAFLWDPQADTVQDARAIMKVSWHPLSWYTARYPDVAEFVSAEDNEHENIGVPKAQEDPVCADEPKAMLIEYWYRRYDARKRRYSINVAYLAGGALLEHAENVYDHGMYPFVVDAYTAVEGYPVGDGMVQELVPMMRYINRYAKYIDTNLRMSSKSRMIIKRDSGIDKAAMADWSQDIIEGDKINPQEDYAWLSHPPFTGMVTNQMLQLQTDLKMDSGQNQFQRGETVGGVTAASAISALQEAGGKITRLRTAVLNQGFKKIIEQIMWLMAQFYTDERVRMIAGVDGKPREVNLSAKWLMGKEDGKGTAPPPYTVQIQVQRRNPLRIQAQNEMFIQAYSMAAQAQQVFPLTALFELLNVDGKERIMPILRETEVVTQQLQQMAQQTEALAQENEQLKQGVSNLQQVNQKLSRVQRGGAAVPAQQTEQPMPEDGADGALRGTYSPMG